MCMRLDRALDDSWQFAQLSHAEAADPQWYETAVPGEVHEVLLEHGVIEDPRVSTNAAAAAWVADSDWVFRTTFGSPVAGWRTARLLFDGVDTVGKAYLNDVHVASFDNLNRRYRADVSGLLRSFDETNELRVEISSPSRCVQEIQAPAEFDILPRERFLRKGSGDFSEYLGARPEFLKVGLHRQVVLSLTDEVWLDDVRVRTRLDGSSAIVLVEPETGGSGQASLHWRLSDPAGAQVATGTRATPDIAWEIEIVQPQLWWPWTHGDQPLYRLEVSVLDPRGDVLDHHEVTFGVRTVELVTEDPDTGEERFAFKVNGRMIFLRGANWAPVEGITHVWKQDRALLLLDLAQRAQMNVLRVWGGGIVPEDAFYDECDRRGILVWQDFMFEYGIYPTAWNQAYDDSIADEVAGMIRHLRNRTCIFLWCGGNENHMGWDFEFDASPAMGRELFEDIIPELCSSLDGTRPYHPNSPIDGPESVGEHVPNWPLSGDWHDYSTVTFSHGSAVPLFGSEVGRASAPSMPSLKRFLPPEELWPEGFDPTIRRAGAEAWPPMWQYHAPDGAWNRVGRIDHYLEPTGPRELARAMGLAHGEYLRNRVERERRGRPNGALASTRQCWGNMVWRLNDPWPIFYWSVIDAFLQPKIAYYFLRRAYAPVLVSFEQTTDELQVWVTNDSPEPVAGELVVQRCLLDGKVRREVRAEVTVESGGSVRVLDTRPLGPISLRDEFLRARFGVGEEVTWLLARERFLHLSEAHLDYAVVQDSIRVSSDTLARQVNVELSDELRDVQVLDNWFDLAPGADRTIRFIGSGRGSITLSALNAPPVTIPLQLANRGD